MFIVHIGNLVLCELQAMRESAGGFDSEEQAGLLELCADIDRAESLPHKSGVKVFVTAEAVRALAEECSWYEYQNREGRREDGTYCRDTYNDYTKTINALRRCFNNCNDILKALGEEPVAETL